LIGRGVRVNAVSPGPISTPLYGKLGLPEADLKAMAANIQNQIPAGRFGNPSEFGELCAYICSAQASFITGQNFLIDGGAYPGTL